MRIRDIDDRELSRRNQHPADEVTGVPDIGEEEVQLAGAGEPIVRQKIRWPSRSLDRMNANKRKREGDLIDTLGEAESHSRGGTDRPDHGGNTEEQPGKRRRKRELTGSTGQDAAHPVVQYKGGNVFAENKAAREAASTGQQILLKTPIPITNRGGTFKVPSPGDSDWSDSRSEEDEAKYASWELDALRKARENSQTHKPRKPSRLRYSTKAYPSPPVATERQSEPPCPPFPSAPKIANPDIKRLQSHPPPSISNQAAISTSSTHTKIGARRHLRR